jgi:hypothetical protein
MKIQLEMKSQYGQQRYYAIDVSQSIPLAYLTGTKTLTKAHLDALTALGFELVVVKVEGRTITGYTLD